jgi:hypothetical protein
MYFAAKLRLSAQPAWLCCENRIKFIHADVLQVTFYPDAMLFFAQLTAQPGTVFIKRYAKER